MPVQSGIDKSSARRNASGSTRPQRQSGARTAEFSRTRSRLRLRRARVDGQHRTPAGGGSRAWLSRASPASEGWGPWTAPPLGATARAPGETRPPSRTQEPGFIALRGAAACSAGLADSRATTNDLLRTGASPLRPRFCSQNAVPGRRFSRSWYTFPYSRQLLLRRNHSGKPVTHLQFHAKIFCRW